MENKEKISLKQYLNKDIKDFNVPLLLTLCLLFLVLVGILTYKVNNSYALFTDTVNGTKTLVFHYKDEEIKVNEPELSENMITVYYDEVNEAWKKADETNKSKKYRWYNYDKKMWANSVTVSSTNRSTYKEAKAGTTIPVSDILTMQVWIPRYKYKVWNYNQNGSQTSTAQTIDITFENGTDTTGDITCEDSISGTNGAASETCTYNNNTCTDQTCNNKTYTHPAFTLGNKELKGIWVGKFETTGTISNITVKPDVQSLRSQKVGAFDNAIREMKENGNIYGFAYSDDTHMMKNSEWGAVAYLSHSKYGINDEVYINNSSSFYTGRSGDMADDGFETNGTYHYNEKKTELNVTANTGTATNLTLSNTSDQYAWEEVSGVYKSTNQGEHDTTSTGKFNITASANTILSFDWSVSSRYYYDKLYFRILNSNNTAIYTSPYQTGYVGRTSESSLPYYHFNYLIKDSGTYTLEVNYQKTGTNSNQGLDKGYIKNVKTIAGATYSEEEVPGGEMASTTGNIYGIYDMSGGAWEYVMGNIVSPDGTTMMSGYSEASSYHSGFTGVLYDSGNYTNYTGTYSYPANKYLDKYSFGTGASQRVRSKLGDGIKEVYTSSGYSWHNDCPYLAYSDYPWFARGGYFNISTIAGVFYSDNGSGNVDSVYSARLVVSPSR